MAAEHRTRLTNDNRTIKNWRHDQHLNQAYFCRKTVRSPGTTSLYINALNFQNMLAYAVS
jgi:hypothetical protein